MTFLASQVLNDASVALIDESHARWSLPEKLGYLNEALREAVVLKPNISTAVKVLTLQAGAVQQLPTEFTVLVEAMSNIVTDHVDEAERVRGNAVRPLPKPQILDQMFPGWRGNGARSQQVQHIIYDLTTPHHFVVFPANNGSGMIEAVVGQRLEPVETDGDPNSIASYDAVVPLDDLYRLALTNFVIGKCYAKDAGIQGSAERAQAYIADFQNGILGRITSEKNIAKAAQGRPA